MTAIPVPTRRPLRTAMNLTAAASAVSLAGVSASVIAGSVVLTRPVAARPVKPHMSVAVHGHGATVEVDGDGVSEPGVWGLATATGYLQVGDLIDLDGSRALRHVARTFGDVHAGQGTSGGIDGAYWPNHLDWIQEAIGDVTVRTVASPAASLPCLWRDGDPQMPVLVAVHGRSSHRAAMLRLNGFVEATGMGLLAMSYRGDGDAVSRRPVKMRLGVNESDDVVAALDQLVGDRPVVLYGQSLGGAVIAQTLLRHRSDGKALHVGRTPVAGVILEAAALDWPQIVAAVARGHRLPGALAPVVTETVRRRGRLDSRALRPVEAGALDDLGVPLLLIHGTDDNVVPVAVTDAAAARTPEATYHRLEGCGHTTAFNLDHVGYTDRLTRWSASFQ